MALEPGNSEDEQSAVPALTLAFSIGAFGLGALMYFGFAQIDNTGHARMPIWAWLIYYLGGKWLGLGIGSFFGLIFLYAFISQMREGESFFEGKHGGRKKPKLKKLRK